MSEVDERTLRNRFIFINLAQIGGTVVVLLALLLWQTNVFFDGGLIPSMHRRLDVDSPIAG